jgi:hypothetical protein
MRRRGSTYFLHNLFLDDGEVVSLTRRGPLPSEASWYLFLLETELVSGP